MNDLIKQVREQYPDDPRTDGQLFMEFGRVASTTRPELFKEFPEFAAQWKQLQRDMRPSAWDEFKGSVGSAVDNLQATTLGAGAMAADLVGADRLKAYLAEQAMEQQRQAAEFTPSVGSYKDIEGAGDAGYFISYALGQVVPSAAESAILALVGAAIGSATAGPGVGTAGGAATGLIAKTAIRNLMKAGVKDFMSEAGKAALVKEARSVAASMGAKVGLAAASIPQAQGEIYNSIGDTEGGAGIAAAAGTLSGLLDLLPESYVLSRFFKPGAQIAKAEANKALAYVKRLGVEATKTMPMEGSTEAAQEFINWASEKYARNEPADITPADVERFTNAGLIGAVGGAMFAPVSAMGTGRGMPAPTQRPAPPTQPTRPVQPVPPVQPPFADSYGEPIGPVSPARASAEAMFAGETDEAGNPISPDRAMRRSDAGAAGLRADLFQQRTQADVAAAPALGEMEDTSGVVTPVDQLFAANANAKGPTEFDYIGKVRAAVQAAQNAERQAQENEAIRIRLEGMAARDNAASVRARQVGLAMMGAAPEPTEFDAMAQAFPQPAPQAPSALPSAETAPVPSPVAAPAITQEPVTPAVAAEPRAAAPEAATPAPASISVPEQAPTPTIPRYTQPGQLAGLTLIRDLRNEPLTTEEKVASVKEIAGKNKTGSAGAVLLLDRGTGTVQLRRVKSTKGRLTVDMAQARGSENGIQNARRTIDFDAPYEGAQLNKILGEVLPDQSPRFEILGTALFKSPEAVVNISLGPVANLDTDPEISKFIALGHQAPAEVSERDRTGRRAPASKAVSFDAIENVVSDDPRAGIVTANEPAPEPIMEGSVEDTTAPVDTEAEAMGRGAAVESDEPSTAGSDQQHRKVIYDAGIAIAEGASELQAKKQIANALKRSGLTPAIIEGRARAGVGVKGYTFENLVDLLYTRAKLVAEEADRLNTIRANAPIRMSETERISLFTRLVQAIRGSGGDVVVFQKNLEAALAPWSQAAGFQLTQADGRSLVGVGLEALNSRDPQAIIALLHETAHHFLNKVITDPALRLRFQDALDRMHWSQQKWLMNPMSTDLRLIANADPATLSEYQKQLLAQLPADQVAKLRATDPTVLLVEQAAEHLAMLGAEKGQARSVLSQIVRLAKDLLLRLAMAYQRTLKGDGAVSDKLVRQFVENRWLQFINQDFANGPLSISSLRNWIGAPSTAKERIAVYTGIGGGDSRVGELDPQTGEIFPTNFVPEDAGQLVDKIANANFTIRRSLDQSIRHTPIDRVNSEFAVLNYIDETVGALFSRLQSVLPKAVLESESPSSAFLKKLLMMHEGQLPETMRSALRTEIGNKRDLDGNKIPYNEHTTLSSLLPTAETYTTVDGHLRSVELNSAQDYALKASLSRLYTIANRVQNDLVRAKERLERFAKRKQLSNKELELQTSLNERAALLERILNDEGVGLKWRIGDLESRIKGATHDIYYAGAEYLVPESSDAAPGKFKTRTLPKDLRFSPALEQEFIANLAAMRHWLDNAENAKYGKEYGRMSHQWNRLSQEFSTTYVYSAVTGNFRKTFLGSLTEHLRAIGTPDAKHAAKQIYRFQEIIMRGHNDAKINGGRWAEAYQHLIDAMGRRNDESFRDQVWDLFQRTGEQIDEGTKDPVAVFRKVFARYGIEFKSKAENDAFRDLVRETRAGERWRRDFFNSLGLKVEDDALIGLDGKPLQRRLLALGYLNGQRHASRLISSLYLTMSPEWTNTKDKVNPLLRLGGVASSNEAEARAIIAKAFPSSVINDFVVPLVRNNSEFITFTHEEALARDRVITVNDGRASQNSVQLAWERSNGDLIAFAKELHKLEFRDEAGVNEAQTIDDVMHSFMGMYEQIKIDAEGRQKAEGNGIEVMARQMMDGRQADNWPPEWVSYGRYDDTSNFMFLMQSALNAAFGKNGLGEGGEFAATLRGIRQNIVELQNTEMNLRREGMTPEQIRKKMGADQYITALQAEDHLYALGQMNDKMMSITKTTGYLLADMRLMTDVLQAQAGMLLQNTRSSILQYFDVLAPFWKTKLSTVSLSAIKKAMSTAATDNIGSVMSALGFEIQLNTANAIRRRDAAGLKDCDRYLTIHQKRMAAKTRFMAPDRPETATERLGRAALTWVRYLRDFSNVGRNDILPNTAPNALAPKFRPFGQFSSASMSVTDGLVDGLYHNMNDLALRGIKLIERTGDAEAYVRGLESGQIKIDPKDMGYVRKWVIFNDKAAYDYLSDALTTKMRERSVEDFIAKAYRRMKAANGDGWTAIDDNQFASLANIATSEYSLQSNLINTPVDMMTNPVLRMLSIFLVWPWGSMMRSGGVFRDAQGRLTKEAMIDGTTLLLMGAIPAALAGSLLVDLYDEKVAGKKANFRELDATSVIPGVGPVLQPLAVLERLARYGTFGLASEAVNGIANYDDARGGFTADNRIFIFNYYQTVRNLLGNLYKQEGEVTYQSHGRPLLQFIGFNGVLQYTQLATRGANAMGANISTQDLAINERINTGNYLRAAGRALEYPVRIVRGQQFIPTPITPYIQQMELAATTDDYELFREAFANAIQQAAKRNEPDPVKYVKDHFAERHPLRRVFSPQLNENQYRTLLSNLNETGRNAVTRTVTSYNKYLERLNLKPVVGKKEKAESFSVGAPTVRPAMSLEQARALAAQASFGNSMY